MCLVEFGVTYATDYRCDDDSDVLPLTEPEATSSQITLTGGFGKMNKGRKNI